MEHNYFPLLNSLTAYHSSDIEALVDYFLIFGVTENPLENLSFDKIPTHTPELLDYYPPTLNSFIKTIDLVYVFIKHHRITYVPLKVIKL